MHSDQKKIQRLCSNFLKAWSTEKRPLLVSFLNQAPPEVDKVRLISALLPIEIRHRIQLGESPSESEYEEFGEEAKKLVANLLDESRAVWDDNADLPTRTSNSDTPLIWENLDKEIIEDASAEPTQIVGRYQLTKLIGHGGMGSVWNARQLSPVTREVALKLVRSDNYSKDAIARFEAERQAIAMMDHQNIAKILDAGTTSNGEPFFAMELVDGIPLNQYCDLNRLTIRQRIKLMLPVCAAVQHAHQKGIIHRDLKHSNVLVVEYDGKPVPKVIDFGLAKALGHQQLLTEKTMLTEIGKVVGTLQYMSPEQAATKNMDIDTRSDVYSIGVMIFKLLVGFTPIQASTNTRLSLITTLESIRGNDSAPPSMCLHNDAKILANVAEQRGVAPDKLRGVIRGDLDWIVLKALDRNRNERYQTAAGLAEDLQRYLNHENINARPPSTWYAIKKFVRRNRGLVASFLGISLILITGIVVTMMTSVWAFNERDRANATASLAEAETIKAKNAEQLQRELQAKAEFDLQALRVKSAWSYWQMGKIESAFRMLNRIDDSKMAWELDFLRSEFNQSKMTLPNHAEAVRSIAFSSDGKQFVSTAADHTLMIWESESRKLLKTCYLSGKGIKVLYSPNSKIIACLDHLNQVTFWNTNGDLIKVLGPFELPATAFEFLSEDQIAIATSDQPSEELSSNRHPAIVNVFDVHSGKLITRLDCNQSTINSIVYDPASDRLVTGSEDHSIHIWHRQNNTFDIQHKLGEHFRGISGLAVAPAKLEFASCSKDGTVRRWDLKSGELLATFSASSDELSSICYSRDGERILTGSKSQVAIIWNTSGDAMFTLKGHFEGINDARFSTDGHHVLTASEDSTMRWWDAHSKPNTVTVREHSGTIWDSDFHVKDHYIASASEDGYVSAIHCETGELKFKAEIQIEAVLTLQISPTGEFIASAGQGTGESDTGAIEDNPHQSSLFVWDATSGKLITSFVAHDDLIWKIAWSPDGKHLATGSADHLVRIWDTENWELIRELDNHAGALASVNYSRDGRYFVSACDAKTVRLWDANSYELLHTFYGHGNSVWRAVFSPDARLLASSSFDGEIILWDVEKRELLRRQVKAHTDQIAGLDFSPDGRRLVSASDDHRIKIWDVESGVELLVLFDRGDSQIVEVAFSPDGTKLISGNADGWVTIRSANRNQTDEQVFLPTDAIEMVVQGRALLVEEKTSDAIISEELAKAEKCSEQFPDYRAFTNLGIAQFRMGNFSEAIPALEEACRLEPIEYGEPDLRPFIEAYLAMAQLKSGNRGIAETIRELFDSKSNQPIWHRDVQVAALQKLVAETFDE